MPLILGTNSIKDTGYDVANSVKFNSDNNDNLSRSISSTSNRRTYTISTWFKRSRTGTNQKVITAGSAGTEVGIQFFSGTNDDALEIYQYSSSAYQFRLDTTALLRDSSAWYHLVVAIDTTQGTDTNRVKIYLNGSQITSFSTATYPSQNLDTLFNNSGSTNYIGFLGSHSAYFNGYFAETVLVDGQQLDATSFGEFDSDSPTIWKPIDVSGLTFGTNGFYLDYEDSSALGADVSGNSNNFTVANLTATDQYTDTCTNNFAVLNPLHQIGSNETSQGNLEYSVSNHHRIISTIAPTSGKWYAEVQGVDSPNKFMAGVAHYPMPANGSNSSFAFGKGVNADVGRFANDFGVRANGDYGNNNSYVSFMSTPSNNDIIGIYMDLDNYKLYMSLNGSLVSSTGKDLTNNGEPYGFISVGEAGTFKWNFGNPSFTVSSGNTDDEGFGNFEFSPNITGDGASKSFFALCTKNLAEYG